MKSLSPNEGLIPNNLAPDERTIYDEKKIISLEEEIEALKKEIESLKKEK